MAHRDHIATTIMDKDLTRIGRFLSLILRHQPEKIGVTLDPQGWIEIDTLLNAARTSGTNIPRELLERIVAENDKKRFAISEDGRSIRASQGHSVRVDLALDPIEPPSLLFHGTATRFLASIRNEGLRPGSRTHVHLSADEGTARTVGARHGKPVVLGIAAEAMHAEGHLFYLSANGVWLTESVPPRYLHP